MTAERTAQPFSLETVVSPPPPAQPIRLRVDFDPNTAPGFNTEFSVNGCRVSRDNFSAVVAMLSIGS